MFKRTHIPWVLLLVLPSWAQAVVSLPSSGVGIAASIPDAFTLLPGSLLGQQVGGTQSSSSVVTVTQNGQATVYHSEEQGARVSGIGSLLPGIGLSSALGHVGRPVLPFRAIGVLSLGGLPSPGLGTLPVGFLPLGTPLHFGPRPFLP